MGGYKSKIGEKEIMNDTEIIAKAPPNTSIVDSKFKFFDDVYCELNEQGEWNWKDTMPSYPIRSLIDIKKIAELEKALKEASEICDAVAHVGVDFGYGVYTLEDSIIHRARLLLEALKEKVND
jgi:hypothetical protein